jgi:hypothetical protein
VRRTPSASVRRARGPRDASGYATRTRHPTPHDHESISLPFSSEIKVTTPVEPPPRATVRFSVVGATGRRVAFPAVHGQFAPPTVHRSSNRHADGRRVAQDHIPSARSSLAAVIQVGTEAEQKRRKPRTYPEVWACHWATLRLKMTIAFVVLKRWPISRCLNGRRRCEERTSQRSF